MTPDDIYVFAQETIATLLWVCGPLMIIALSVGLIIALFQALTSIQEVTLTFVPKILIVFIAMIFLMPYMANRLGVYSTNLFDKISSFGVG